MSPAGRLSVVEEYFCALASFLLSSTGVFVVISHQECNLFKLPFDLTNHTIFSVNHIQVFYFMLGCILEAFLKKLKHFILKFTIVP